MPLSVRPSLLVPFFISAVLLMLGLAPSARGRSVAFAEKLPDEHSDLSLLLWCQVRQLGDEAGEVGGAAIGRCGHGACSLSVEDISPHTAPDLHACHAHSYSVQAFLVRDYLD